MQKLVRQHFYSYQIQTFASKTIYLSPIQILSSQNVYWYFASDQWPKELQNVPATGAMPPCWATSPTTGSTPKRCCCFFWGGGVVVKCDAPPAADECWRGWSVGVNCCGTAVLLPTPPPRIPIPVAPYLRQRLVKLYSSSWLAYAA